MSAADRIRAAFAAHGVRGALHARDLATDAEVAVDADVPMPLASVYKVALVTALFRSGLDLTERVTSTERSAGPTGTAAMLDPATLSLRDLAYLAIAVSDNGAADVLLDRLGADALTAVHAELGMDRTHFRHAARDFAATLLADTATTDAAAAAAALAADPALLDRLQVRDPARTNGGSARDQTRLLGALWGDAAAPPEACAAVRRLLGLQVWPHRLASGFPDAAVAGKTGTLPGVRNEVGVVEDDERTVALAVLTVAPTPAASMPHLDALIGSVARMAWDGLAER